MQYDADKFERDVRSVLEDIADLLVDKNKKYGDSALNPQRIFSTTSTIEQIDVRIDDKLSRIKNMNTNNIEDVKESVADSIKDLVGYLVMREIATRRQDNEK